MARPIVATWLFQTGNVVTGTYGTNGTINATVNGNRLTGTWSRNGSAGSIDWWMGGTGLKWRGNYNAHQWLVRSSRW
ncbi:MAG: hypothetical protein U0559_05115 [Anaerolineae bacterium]